MNTLPSTQPYRPGFLLSPLGWLNERLSLSPESEPQLLSALFVLEPYAMHLLGIGVAHCCDDRHVKSLFAQTPRAIVESSIGYWPEGLDRLLRALPAMALSPDEYRAIPQLLSDGSTAKFLHHCRTITGPIIAGLFALPSALRRPAIFSLFGRFEKMDRFVPGLRFLGNRAGIAFDDLIRELSALNQTEQVIAKIAELVDNLPLPATLPPSFVGSFRRIDQVDEIRRLAKGWHNCLADCLHTINGGTGAVYRSDNAGPPAVALVLRFDRLGWVLSQIKGPKNIDIDSPAKRQLESGFYDAGIPSGVDVEAIRDLVVQTRWKGLIGN